MHQAKCPSQQLQSMQLMSSIQSSGRKQSSEPSSTFIYQNAETSFRSMTHPDRAAENETNMRPSAHITLVILVLLYPIDSFSQ